MKRSHNSKEPALCDCGEPGYRRDGSGWFCRDCEIAVNTAQADLAARRRKQEHELEMWEQAERRREYEAEYRFEHQDERREIDRRSRAKRNGNMPKLNIKNWGWGTGRNESMANGKLQMA